VIPRLATVGGERDQVLGLLAAEALRAGREVKFRALGSSMIPAIWPGDILVAKPAASSCPEVGEIALILNNHGLLAHRVVRRREDAQSLSGSQSLSIVTRGDALAECDAVVPASAVLGLIVSRNGRRLRGDASASGFCLTLNRMASCAPVRWVRLKTRGLRLRALRNAPRICAIR